MIPSSFDWYWLFLLAVPFFLPEILAGVFRKKKGDTFSEFHWKVFAIYLPTPRFGHLRRFILGSFGASLCSHVLVVASVWPIVIFGAGCAWCYYYYFKYERGR